MPRPLYRRPDDSTPPDDATTRALRSLYRTPADPAYWDGLESRIMSAVRDGAAQAARPAVEWWQALARWTRPGLAAAAVLLVATGLVTARAGQGEGSAFRRLLGGAPPATPLREADPELARLLDGPLGEPLTPEARDEARMARDAADLLGEGLERRRAVRLDSLTGAAGPAHRVVPRIDGRLDEEEAARRAAREAALGSVLPED